MMLLLLLGQAFGDGGLSPWPQVEDTVPGECGMTIGITKSQPIPPSILGQDAFARCSFIAEPLSSYAHLLAIESHAREIRQIYDLDTTALRQDRDYWQAEANRATVWYRQPWFVAVTTSALVTGLYVTYHWSNGGHQ